MFEIFIQQTGEINHIIEQIPGIIIAIGGIITAIGTYSHSKSTRDKAYTIGQYATTFGQKTAENTQVIEKLVSAGYQLAPDDVKKQIQLHEQDLKTAAERAAYAKAQLEYWNAKLDEKSKADNNPEIPRETDAKPGTI